MNSKIDYVALEKKEKSYNSEAKPTLENWLSTYQVTPEMVNYDHNKAQKCAKDIIDGLKNVPILPRNKEKIKSRLKDFCEINASIREYIKKYFKELQGDPTTLKEIKVTLILTI
ncbi:MAG TPA: hypothetical protein VHA52_07770 [Candidatus Babeliaceae bacterium]|nr:hypothetical protein [Candidatus Babeliaceae bacterium]